MIIVKNLSKPRMFGDYLIKDVKLAFKKMGKDISFTTNDKEQTYPNSQFWVIGLGEYSIALESKIISALQKVSASSPNGNPICITVGNLGVAEQIKPLFRNHEIWTILNDPRAPKSLQPPETPSILWVGSSALVDEECYPNKGKFILPLEENIAGKRIAKILSRLSEKKEPPLGGGIGLPHKAMIEVNRSCNLQCVLCPAGNSQAKKFPPMDTDVFKQIINTIASSVWKAKLYNYGEPLLHPRLPDFVKYSKDAGIEWVEISTNGILLTTELSEKLISSGLDFLRISIDGIDQKTYAKYRRGGLVDQIWNNLREFRGLRDQVKKKRPEIEVQCLATCDTEGKLEELKQMALYAGADDFRVKTFNVFMSGESMVSLGIPFLPNDQKLSRYRNYTELNYRDKYKLSSCRWPYERLVVNADGTIVPCCYDFNADYILGSFRSTQKHWWWTPERQSFIDHLDEIPCSIGMCARCPVGVPILTASRD